MATLNRPFTWLKGAMAGSSLGDLSNVVSSLPFGNGPGVVL